MRPGGHPGAGRCRAADVAGRPKTAQNVTRRPTLRAVVSPSSRLQDQVTAFLEHCELDRNLSPLTVRMYDQYLSFLVRWAATEQVSSAETITPEVVQRYRLHLARFVSPNTRRNLARGTQTSYLVAFRSL